MKLIKLSVIITLVIVSASKLNAQFELGGNLSAIRIPSYGVGMYGVSLRGDFLFKEEHPVYVSVNYFFPRKFTYSQVLKPLPSAPSNTPDFNYQIKEQTDLITLMAGYKKYFNDDPDDNGFYGIGEAGLGYFGYSYAENSYNPNLYGGDGGFGIDLSEGAISYYLGLGIGYQLVGGNDGKLFSELKLGASDFSFNSRTGLAPQSIPLTYGLSIGYRIPLGG